MVIPDEGSVTIENERVYGQHSYRENISYLPQIARFPVNLTGLELINFMKGLRKGKTKEEQLIDLFGLHDELNKKMSVLSGGTRQKLNLVLSFMYDTPIIILDEPSTGLDPLALLQLKNYLEQEVKNGKQILIITHILSLVEALAENVVFILDGKIYYQGGTQELIQSQGGQDLEHAIANILKRDGTHI
jgi:Cu-processing system ATP-binding protein